MPVEINLLPGRKNKARTLPLVFLLIGVLGLIGLLVIISVASSMESERNAVEAELQEARLESAALESELNELESNDILLLEEMILELDEKMVPASSVLAGIVSHLPPESTLTMFDYDFPDQVTVEGLFTSMPELARFQYALENSSFVQVAEVDVVFGEEIIEELEEGFWYEDYLPQYFATLQLTLHPDAARSFEVESVPDQSGVQEDASEEVDDAFEDEDIFGEDAFEEDEQNEDTGVPDFNEENDGEFNLEENDGNQQENNEDGIEGNEEDTEGNNDNFEFDQEENWNDNLEDNAENEMEFNWGDPEEDEDAFEDGGGGWSNTEIQDNGEEEES